ncbi:hypothetical protein [Shewanella mangrovisoli]|uniref:hypothetical protein n=1 Tax=Shewanella mangrovisoli TaxID=2864211 RepID=UPI0035B77B9B
MHLYDFYSFLAHWSYGKQIALMLERQTMVIGETTVRPMDGAVEHPWMDLLRVVEPVPWLASLRGVSSSLYHGWPHSVACRRACTMVGLTPWRVVDAVPWFAYK